MVPYTNNNGKSSSLPTGAIAGIVIGLVAIAGALLALAILMRRRIERRRLLADALANNKPERPFLDAELDDMGDPGPKPVSLTSIFL